MFCGMMNIQITVLKLFFPPACQQWRYGEFFFLACQQWRYGDLVIDLCGQWPC
jgi:hypothetical protein